MAAKGRAAGLAERFDVAAAIAETRALQAQVDGVLGDAVERGETMLASGEVAAEWKKALSLVDEVEEALARSGQALEVHLQVAAAQQRYRQKLLEGAELFMRLGSDARATLPADAQRLFAEAEQLRLSAGAATQLALSLTADAAEGEDEEDDVTRIVTDRLP